EALYQRQAELEALVENSPDMIARMDRELRAQYVNPAAREVLGIAPEEFFGRTTQELGLPAALYEPWNDACRRAFASAQIQNVAFSFESPSTAGERHLQTRIVPEFAPDGSGGQVESLLSITTDVTEQTRAAEALRYSEERFRQFAENSRDVLWIFDVRANRI